MAQLKKGERLFEIGRYQEAIKPLKKAFNNNSGDRQAGLLLAETFYILQRYDDALDIANMMDLENSLVESEIIVLTDILIANTDFSRAYLTLLRYISQSSFTDLSYNWLNKTADLINWDTIPATNRVLEIAGINSIYNEYAPLVTSEGISYLADHLTVQSLYPTAFTNQSLHILFKSQEVAKESFARPKQIMKDREYYFHDGPLEESVQNDFALTLREIEGRPEDLMMNIYFTELTGKEDDLSPFKFNGSFNTGHPTFNAEKTRMYFTSDRPGGYGQLDIWYSDWSGEDWSIPVNAGPVINSAKNDLYPRIANNRLFFSSDRRDAGYGGLDLYYVTLSGADEFAYNLRAPINTRNDDFAVDFINVYDGYFSSNRPSEFGGDDIYKLYFQPYSIKLDTLMLSLLDAQDHNVAFKVMDISGNEIASFDNNERLQKISCLQTRHLYTIKSEGNTKASLKLGLFDQRGELIREFNSSSPEFMIELLEQDIPKDTQRETANEQVTEKEALILDKVFFVMEDGDGVPLSLRIYNKEGQELLGVKEQNQTTSFSGIQVRQVYTIKTDSIWEEEISLVAQNDKGNLLKEFLADSSVFDIEFLEEDYYKLKRLNNLDDSDLLGLSDSSRVKDLEASITTTATATLVDIEQNEIEDDYIAEKFDITSHFGDNKISEVVTFDLRDRDGNSLKVSMFDSQGNEIFGIEDPSNASGLNTKEEYTVKTNSPVTEEIFLQASTQSGQKINEFKSTTAAFKIKFLDEEEFVLNKQQYHDQSQLYALSGAVLSDQEENFENVSILIKDRNGIELDKVNTDSEGKFKFKNLSLEQEYYLTTLGIIGNAEIDVFGKSGAPTNALEKSEGGSNTFTYTRSRPEAAWMINTAIEIPMVFAIVPSADVSSKETPELHALGDSLIRNCRVDEDGFIQLGSLTTGRAYELKFDMSSFHASDRLVILDGNGDTTQTVRPDEHTSFVFELMPPSAKIKASEPEISEASPIESQEETKNDISLQTFIGEEKRMTSTKDQRMNLFGSSTGLAKGTSIKTYGSDKRLLSETYILEDGSFAINQIPIDSVFYVFAIEATNMKLTSAYHGFDRQGTQEEGGWWKFDFTRVDEMEKVITLANVYYKFDSYTLSPESKAALDNLYSYLVQNPAQKIKILSHTDSRGPRAYNEILSNNRAREVVRYLIRQGIDESRLSYEGRGESQPVNECKDGVWCPNERHAENRRTEFVLIKN